MCARASLPHQHLEEHVSAYCPLSEVECEFSDAGCDARVCRKDLPSHLAENMVAHMSLLALENRKLKLQLTEQEKKVIESDKERRELKLQLKQQDEKLELRLELVDELLKLQEGLRLEVTIKELRGNVKMLSTEQERKQNYLISEHAKINPRLPPLEFQFKTNFKQDHEPFYSHLGGYRLKPEILYTLRGMAYKFSIIGSEFVSRRAHSLLITSEIPRTTQF